MYLSEIGEFKIQKIADIKLTKCGLDIWSRKWISTFPSILFFAFPLLSISNNFSPLLAILQKSKLGLQSYEKIWEVKRLSGLNSLDQKTQIIIFCWI